MNIHQAYPKVFLTAEGFAEQTLTIKGVAMEPLGDVQKPVLRFKEIATGFVINKLCGGILAKLFGPDTDRWTGRRVTLYPTTTDFRGRQVPAIRVKAA